MGSFLLLITIKKEYKLAFFFFFYIYNPHSRKCIVPPCKLKAVHLNKKIYMRNGLLFWFLKQISNDAETDYFFYISSRILFNRHKSIYVQRVHFIPSKNCLISLLELFLFGKFFHFFSISFLRFFKYMAYFRMLFDF